MRELACVLCLAISSVALGDRVEEARDQKLDGLKRLAREYHLKYPLGDVVLRAYKREKSLEVWAANSPVQPHRRILIYPIAAASGSLGPKRKEGDNQVPEGFYPINQFNPTSRFLLSLRVGYPNRSDRILGGRRHLGGDIYIHGNHVSIGCLAITDDKIRELYVLCYDSYRSTNRMPSILILPYCSGIFVRDWPHAWVSLWTQLYGINRRFKRTHVVPRVQIDSFGNYRLP